MPIALLLPALAVPSHSRSNRSSNCTPRRGGAQGAQVVTSNVHTKVRGGV
ncbi:hypothetical protein Y09_0182 [Brachybacterium sp. SW0106-09]|nr:hypothetical protein Y09_0182 [Brachybacterium sp. SW0106-09]